jgi:hypothetical protein
MSVFSFYIMRSSKRRMNFKGMVPLRVPLNLNSYKSDNVKVLQHVVLMLFSAIGL